MYSTSCANGYHDITIFEACGMVLTKEKNAYPKNMTFPGT